MVSGRNPDLAIVFSDAPADARGRRQPSWVAEIVSEGGEQRDYVTKREEYLVFGVKEYWIVDPRLRRVTVLIREDATNGPQWSERQFQGEEVIASALLPGYQGKVADLWIDVESDERETEHDKP
jgi:Uma2 family endonuclease